MLPDYLSSSYARYKEDTQTVASWLANTAAQHGYTCGSTIKPAEFAKPSTGRLKGKARKEAKAAAAAPHLRISESERIISVKDFANLSRHIATAAVTVPKSIIRTLDRAIQIRRAHVAWHSSNAQGCDQHAHFINVLEDVKHTLEPLKPSATTHVEAKVPESESHEDNLRSRFEPLSLDADDDETISPITEDANGSDKQPGVKIAMNPEEELVESYFAVSCFFDDLNTLLAFVSQVWTDYRERNLHIVPTAITINTAIDLARSLEESLYQIVPKSCSEIVRMQYEACCQATSKNPDSTQENGLFNYEAYDAADESLLTIFTILATCPDTQSQMDKKGPDTSYSPREHMTNQEKYHRDQEILNERICIVDLTARLMMRHKENAPILDDFTRAILIWRNGSVHDSRAGISFWILFAAKVYLLSHHILGDSISRGCLEVYKTGTSVNFTLEEHVEFHDLYAMPFDTTKNMAAAKCLQKIIHQWATPPTEARAKIDAGDLSAEPVLAMAKETFLANNPLMCGLIVYRLIITLHECGLSYANATCSILYAGHLYHAVKQEQLLHQGFGLFEDVEWADLEMAMGFQGDKAFFFGGRPVTKADYEKQWCLSMGLSATYYAKNRRNIQHTVSKKIRKKMGQLATCSQVFLERFLTNTPRFDMTVDDVEKIISKARSIGEGHTKRELRHRSPVKGDDRQCTPEQLLASLSTALQAEVSELTFDCLRLHRTCWRLFVGIIAEIGPDLKRTYGEKYARCTMLPCTVGLIFQTALEEESPLDSNSLLSRAADIISALVRTSDASCEYRTFKDGTWWGINYTPTFVLPEWDEGFGPEDSEEMWEDYDEGGNDEDNGRWVVGTG